MSTIVQRLKDNFSKFEKAIQNIPNKKVELTRSKTTVTVDEWWPKNSVVRQGVNYDFVRFYRGTTTETKEMTVGFSFNFEDDAPIVVALHDKDKRYTREFSIEEFKSTFKKLIKDLEEKKMTGFIQLAIAFHDGFELQKGIEKTFKKFDAQESVSKALDLSVSERIGIESKLKELEALKSEEKTIRSIMNYEIQQAIKQIEESYQSQLNPLENKIGNKKTELSKLEEIYVEKLKSTFDNYDMTMEKYLMHLAKEMPFPKSIVSNIKSAG